MEGFHTMLCCLPIWVDMSICQRVGAFGITNRVVEKITDHYHNEGIKVLTTADTKPIWNSLRVTAGMLGKLR